jgi:hypothetical protein
MPKRNYTLRDWAGGINNRKDPRDIPENESSFIQNMSIDALGKIKTMGGIYAHSKDADGSTDMSQYIVNRTCGIGGSGGYGLFYFESDHSRDYDNSITETKSGTALGLGTSASGNVGKINFTRVKSTTDTPADIPESGL